MAVTETVKIVFEVDDKALSSSIDVLQKLGKVSEEDAAKFRQLSESTKAVTTSLDSAATAADEFANSSKAIGTGAKEIGAAKPAIDSAGKAIKDVGKSASDTGKQFLSLRSQLKNAKDEIIQLTRRFGENSKEVDQAKAKAGQLTNQIGDLNRQISLLNPEDKFKAFSNIGQGIVGSFQIATGALQAFGVENERVQEIAQRLQGVLNLAQGLQSISQLKESFKDLGVVVSATANAGQALTSGAKGFEAIGGAVEAAADNTEIYAESLESTIGAAGNTATLLGSYRKAQDAATASTKTATVAQGAFNRVLLANPAFAAAAAIGALVGGFLLYSKLSQESNQQTQEQIDLTRELQLEADKLSRSTADRVAAERQASDVALGNITNLNAEVKKNEDARKQAINDLISEYDKLNAKLVEQGQKPAFFISQQEIFDINKIFGLREQTIIQTSKLRDAELEVSEARKKQNEELAKSNNIIDQEKKRRSDAIALLREQGKSQDFILQKQIENNNWEIKALQNLRAKNGDLKISEESQRIINEQIQKAENLGDKARIASLNSLKEQLNGAKGREQVQQRINQLLRDNVLINAQIANFETSEAVKNIEQRLAKKNEELDLDKQRGRLQSQILQDEINANNEAIVSLEAVIEADKLTNNNLEKQADILNKIAALRAKNATASININKAIADEQDEILEQQLKSLDIFYQNELFYNAKSLGDSEARNAADLKSYKKFLEDKIAALKAAGKSTTELETQLADTTTSINKAAAEEEVEIRESIAETVISTSEFVAQLAKNNIDNEIFELEQAREKGLITEEQYQDKLRALKIKQAKNDKELAIFAATVQFSQALINALTTTPASAAPAALAFTAAIAGINLAKVIATPIPKFKQGTLAVPGYDTGDDSVMAMLRPGEAVIPTETNREYAAVIRAIYTKQVSSKELNEFVTNRNMTVVNEPVFDFNKVTLDALFKRDIRTTALNSAVVKRTGGDMPTIKVKADVDTQALGRAMAKNKGVDVNNADYLAQAIASELKKGINPRQLL